MSVRIGHSPGSATGFSGGDDAGGQRAARFRSVHRTGDTVRGVFLRPAGQSAPVAADSGGMGWVDIGDQTLLASMPAFPQPGTELLFRVERLEPDIVLRLLADADTPGGRGGHGAPPLSPARLAAAYATARDRLDARLADALFPAWAGEDAPLTAHARHAAFAAHVAEDAETAQLFVQSTRARLALLAVLGAALPGVALLHLPWLCPRCRALDCAVIPPPADPARAGGLVRVLLGGTRTDTADAVPGQHGRFLLHGLLRPAMPNLADRQDRPARLAFRVMGHCPGHPALPPDGLLPFHAATAGPPPELVLLGTGPLPPGPADPLGLLLASLHGGGLTA